MNCPICNTACRAIPLDNADAHKIKCGICGTYVATGQYLASKGISLLIPIERVKLGGVIREAEDEGRAPPELDYPQVAAILSRTRVPGALEQADAMIDFIARKTTFGEHTALEHEQLWACRLFMKSVEAFKALAGALHVSGLMNGKADETVHGYRLTLAGWERARAIQKTKGSGNQAFVAVWFHGGMNNAFNLGFEPALKETGYEPYRVDRAHHNNRIDDEIMGQIRRSKILVADATGARPSVYYEAGFAYGLDIPVIWCCNSALRGHAFEPSAVAPDLEKPPAAISTDWFKCVAFDTNHLNFILWATETELHERLAARIRGLGLALTDARPLRLS